MGKMYKGYELIEAMSKGKIKNGTKIIPHYPNNDCTVEYFEYYSGFISVYYKEKYMSDKRNGSNDVNVCVFINEDRLFEVVDKDIDIEKCKTWIHTIMEVINTTKELNEAEAKYIKDNLQELKK